MEKSNEVNLERRSDRRKKSALLNRKGGSLVQKFHGYSFDPATQASR